MAIETITHTFFDIDIEPADSPDPVQLVKILSVDGRRFTYEFHGELTPEGVEYIKSLLDAAVFSDLIIEITGEGLEAREATKRLKKHS